MGVFFEKPDIDRMAKKLDLNGLIKASKHKDPRVRCASVGALGEWFARCILVATNFQLDTYESEKGGDRLALRAILNALDDEYEQTRRMACFNLVFTWGTYERANELASNDLNEQDRKKIAGLYKQYQEVYKRGMSTEDCEALDRGFSRIQ